VPVSAREAYLFGSRSECFDAVLDKEATVPRQP